MKVQHTGERIKAALELSDVAQSALAATMQTDPGAVSRTLSQSEIDGWTAFRYGVALQSIVGKRNRRQVSQS